ncbi:MAG: DUF2087 domain-containing protein [Pseudomonadota bacterium]
MPRTPMPLCVDDVSDFARTLRRQLDDLKRIPGHVEMLNLLARAGGYRNIQHLRARQAVCDSLDAPRPAPVAVDFILVKRLMRLFDDRGRLMRWPKKYTQRMLCLWGVWARIPARTAMTEPEMNRLLEQQHLFGDHALLRRELADHGLVTRTPDGRQYTRCERKPPPEAVELLRHLRTAGLDTD